MKLPSAALMAVACSLVLGSARPAAPPRRGPATDSCAPPAAPLDAASLVAAGRPWHALRSAAALPTSGPPAALHALVHAGIAEGLGRWEQVDGLVRRARGGDSLPDFVALAARADERAGRWAAAEAKYRRLLAWPAAAPGVRALAAARLALVFERWGRRDSASAAWRRAAQALPELADWFALRRGELVADTALAFAAVSGARTPGAAQRADLLVARRRLAVGNLRGALEVYRRLNRPLDVARVEFALGRRRSARLRADSILISDPARPTALLAATFLTQRFDTLSVTEYLAVSRAYRARGDLPAAERFARRAIARSDTSVRGWLELATVESVKDNFGEALAAVDSAGTRARRRQVTLVAAARLHGLAAAERWDEADTLARSLVRAHPGDSSIARALMALADGDRVRGQREAEHGRYRTLVRRFPRAPATLVARFRLALIAYARGERDSAAARIADVVARDSARQLGLAARYWGARLAFERADSAAAAALGQIAAEGPISFYGVRAREVLGDSLPLAAETALTRPRPGSFPPARARERIRLLAGLGLGSEARAEAAGWANDTAASVHVLLAVASAAADAGLAREAIGLGEAARERAGMVLGTARALFPFPYRGVIEAEAAEQCVDPLLLAAIIRQESRFEPRALSRAGARGIGQVMPRTGRELAARMSLGPWDADLLYVPDFNLHLGARYLYERIALDSLPLHAVLAAYNAGPERVERWRRWPEFRDPDLFAERVPIGETRDYVKIVYASYLWYRLAYHPFPGQEPSERALAPPP